MAFVQNFPFISILTGFNITPNEVLFRPSRFHNLLSFLFTPFLSDKS